jgi:hypothetical protein
MLRRLPLLLLLLLLLLLGASLGQYLFEALGGIFLRRCLAPEHARWLLESRQGPGRCLQLFEARRARILGWRLSFVLFGRTWWQLSN